MNESTLRTALKTHACVRFKLRARQLALVAIMLAVVSIAQSGIAATNLIHVTTTVQGDSRSLPGGPLCSLTEAIFAANTHTNKALDSSGSPYATGCETGTGNDTIVLSNAQYRMTDIEHNIQHSRYGPTATPVIISNITIQGNGANIFYLSSSPMRAFVVGYDQIDLNPGGTPDLHSGCGNLTLQNVWIEGFPVKGGDGGAGGGGGGLGAGGAIYVDGQVVGQSCGGNVGLTVVNSTFSLNSATGGNGGLGNTAANTDSPNQQTGPGGGGGGGLAGNGGAGTDAGGGGGGAFGDGGSGWGLTLGGGGGGGGGTDAFGQPGGSGGGGTAGFCGGAGGSAGSTNNSNFSGGNASDAGCAGGGGGGGGATAGLSVNGGHGGKGSYGGGGGGAGFAHNNGGDGDYGGGGGGAADCPLNPDFTNDGISHSGNGGFGGGGGGQQASSVCLDSTSAGIGGRFAGNGLIGGSGVGTVGGGGGGAGLGGVIFSDSSTVLIQNSTFNANFVQSGAGAGGAGDGIPYGGAIFARGGSLTIQDSTISGNFAAKADGGTSPAGGGIVVVNDGSSASLLLQNTIIAGNYLHECVPIGSFDFTGSSGNLIQDNYGCQGVAVLGKDPLLASIFLNAPGNTPTMELLPESPAIGAADASLNATLPTDQRGVNRKPTPDIGAYETPAPSADLAITKSVSSAAAVPGDTVTYTLVVTNKGPNDANTVIVTDTLPTYLTFVSCSESTGGGVCSGGSTVTVAYATLANGKSSTITINAKLNSGVTDGLVIGNSASVSAASPPDPDTSNNTSTAYFTVHNRADLAVTKTVSSSSPYWPAQGIEVGDPLTYTVTLTNKGPYDARGVSLTDSAPTGVTFTGCTASVGMCLWSGTSASLSLSALTNGSVAALTIQATLNFGVADGSTITNTASVTSTTFDPDTSNNSASASFTVLNNSDLFVFQSATKLPQRQLQYTVQVTNLGKYQAKKLVLIDPAPSGSAFVSITPGPWACSTPAVGSLGTISCSLDTEAVGVTQTLVFVVKISTPGNTLINNTASVSAATFDPNTANNTATLSTKLGP